MELTLVWQQSNEFCPVEIEINFCPIEKIKFTFLLPEDISQFCTKFYLSILSFSHIKTLAFQFSLNIC